MSDDELRLFEPPGPVELSEKLSPDRRRTVRQRDMLDRGIHPATGARLLNEEWGLSCKDCVHCVEFGHNLRTYWKCRLAGISRGPGTDIRMGWPACSLVRVSGEADSGE